MPIGETVSSPARGAPPPESDLDPNPLKIPRIVICVSRVTPSVPKPVEAK
jgi:hypothetical protein